MVEARGIVLEFCKMLGFDFLLHFAKFFGHRPRNNSPNRCEDCVRFPSFKTSTKKKNTARGGVLFLVEARGVVLEKFGKPQIFLLLLAEFFFGHRSKTLPRRVFSLRSTPRFMPSPNEKKHPCGCFFVWWRRGESNPCPKIS